MYYIINEEGQYWTGETWSILWSNAELFSNRNSAMRRADRFIHWVVKVKYYSLD